MNLITSLRTLLLAGILSIGISYAYATWAPPSALPTNGNAEAPINVGSATQVKAGALTVGGLFTTLSNVFIGGNVGIGVDDPNAKLHIGGTAGVDGIRFPDGTLQTTAYIVPSPYVPGPTVYYQCPSVGSSCNGSSTGCRGQISTSPTCQAVIRDTEVDNRWRCRYESQPCSLIP